MKCPVCDVTLSISSRDGGEIDFCPQCRGVWLDRGELDKIIDRTAALSAPPPPTAASAPPPAYGDRYREERYDDRRDDHRYDDRHYKKRKKRSFLEEMFDFD